ncbi:MAG: hypothetical protein EB078_01890 [Proteobacteria bacterium]|nr:hypothetical protein [Pseudomonadota bacterium]
MANKIQIKRTAVSTRTPNTTTSANSSFIDAGELALNITDGKMFSSNGSVFFEVGANLSNLNVSSNATIGQIIANGTFGTSGQQLFSNGTGMYWDTFIVPSQLFPVGDWAPIGAGLSYDGFGVNIDSSFDCHRAGALVNEDLQWAGTDYDDGGTF